MIDRDNVAWLHDLSTPGKKRTQALSDLRKVLLRGLGGALRKWVRQDTREFLSLCEDFVQETLLSILKNLDKFQGLARFTTWAHKICICYALSELRRARWKDYSLTSFDGDNRPLTAQGSSGDSEQERVESQMMLSWIQKVMQEELSVKQRMTLKAAAFDGVSADSLATKLGTTRNALYKLLHDARLKIKKRMFKEGLMKMSSNDDQDNVRNPSSESSKIR